MSTAKAKLVKPTNRISALKVNVNAKGKAVKRTLEYSSIKSKLNGSLKDVAKMPIGRDGAKITPRRFHIPPQQVKQFKDDYAKTKRIPNPHNMGAYFAFVESLIILGGNKPHSFQTVKAEMKTILSAKETIKDGKTAWQRYINKDAHSDDNAKSVDNKLKQNAEVLQRLGGMTPYGYKLLQVGKDILGTKGMTIDILKGKDGKEVLYRLNTNSDSPINEFRRARQ